MCSIETKKCELGIDSAIQMQSRNQNTPIAIRHVVPKDTPSFAVVPFASSPKMGQTNVGRIKTLNKLRRTWNEVFLQFQCSFSRI